MQPSERRPSAIRGGLIIVGTLATAYMASHFFRASNVTIVLSVGLLGNLIATTPLAWASEISGWRAVFGAAVLFTAIAAVAVWIVVRDAPPGHPFLARKQEAPGEMLQGLFEVLRNPLLWP